MDSSDEQDLLIQHARQRDATKVCHFRTHASHKRRALVAALFNRLARMAERKVGRSDVIIGRELRGIQVNDFSSALASRGSAVSKPSRNQP